MLGFVFIFYFGLYFPKINQTFYHSRSFSIHKIQSNHTWEMNLWSRSKQIHLFSLRLILRHDLPILLAVELFDEKLARLLTESTYFFFSRECWESLVLLQDKFLPVDGEDSISELEYASFSFFLNFALVEASFDVKEPLRALKSSVLSPWSEHESNSSDTSLIPLFSKMARTSAVAFSAFLLWRATNFSWSSSSATCKQS